MKDKPFALIGVNVTGHAAKKLKLVMEKFNLTWRTFADPGDSGPGPIVKQWNMAATPTMYIIDHKGIIRHKWLGAPGEKAIDAALEKLIPVAERDGKK
ncbi:MAG: hypothetical protein HY290_06390 [Planctomycetia bacterium]|nr:hypothetical protein [Planctomycetia bacterium]